MEYTDYLTETGVQIYDSIKEHLVSNGWYEDAFEFELLMLAEAYATYLDVLDRIKAEGEMQVSKNGYQTVNGLHVIKNKQYTAIKSMSPKFGLNPVDFMAKFSKEKKKEGKLDAFKK